MRARACMNHIAFEIATETFSESQFWIRVKVNQKTEDKLAKECYPCEFGDGFCFLLLFNQLLVKSPCSYSIHYSAFCRDLIQQLLSQLRKIYRVKQLQGKEARW